MNNNDYLLKTKPEDLINGSPVQVDGKTAYIISAVDFEELDQSGRGDWRANGFKFRFIHLGDGRVLLHIRTANRQPLEWMLLENTKVGGDFADFIYTYTEEFDKNNQRQDSVSFEWDGITYSMRDNGKHDWHATGDHDDARFYDDGRSWHTLAVDSDNNFFIVFYPDEGNGFTTLLIGQLIDIETIEVQ